MTLQIKRTKNSAIKKFVKLAMPDLDSFFNLNWKDDQPNIIIMKDRKTIDLLQNRKTESWLVGWADKDVYILDYKKFGIESAYKYSREEYNALIKHELAHCFSNIITDNSRKPAWLLEGISIFLSGQLKMKKKRPKLKNFISYYNKHGKEIYSESGFAVEYLVRKYGKRKLLKLLKASKDVDSKKDFADLFKSIYKFELKYNNFKI